MATRSMATVSSQTATQEEATSAEVWSCNCMRLLLFSVQGGACSSLLVPACGLGAPSTGPVQVVLKLKNPTDPTRVKWTEGTVDNEHLGRKSSKSKLAIVGFVDFLLFSASAVETITLTSSDKLVSVLSLLVYLGVSCIMVAPMVTAHLQPLFFLWTLLTSCILHPAYCSPECCIYHKPKRFDESSDESEHEEDECPHGSHHSHEEHNKHTQSHGAWSDSHACHWRSPTKNELYFT